MTDSFKEIAEFISENIDGCKFVGISSENEVFIEFSQNAPEREEAVATTVRTRFPHVERVIVVMRPSVGEVKEMVDGLNKYLNEEPKKKDLLDIGSF